MGEDGEGGVLERVVVELLFIDQRRVGILRPSVNCMLTSGAAASPARAISKTALSVAAIEFVRRKRLDIVRLKLLLEDPVRDVRLVKGTDAGS